MTTPQRILIVDDNDVNLAVLRELLEDNFQVESAATGEECLELAVEYLPELILLDIMMPGIGGYETCRRLRANDRLQDTKVLMVSARALVSERLEGYEAGADDYITKPFDDEELLSKVRVYLQLRRAEESDAATQELNAQLEAEVVRRREAEEKLRHDALHDVLTSLPNRALLMDRIERCLVRSRNEPDFKFAVLFLDLDDFKLVNDSLGHRAGDHYLVEIGHRLSIALRTGDSVAQVSGGLTARLGGDEFVVLVEGLQHDEDAGLVAERLRSVLGRPIVLNGNELRPTASIGIALGRPDYELAGEVLRDADTALYHAKRHGKNRGAFFDKPMRQRVIERLRLESELAHAIENDELVLHYQPIVDLETQEVQSLEALVRWDHPVRGLIAPAEFIPVAEETGLIVPLGNVVLRSACLQTAQWRRMFPDRDHLSISVNFSGKQFADPGVVDQISAVLEETGLQPDHLNLELTETVLVKSSESDESALKRLTDRRLKLHMDDFGTGYSSLSYLARLPISVLKLDRAFVQDMVGSDAGTTTIKAVLQMAHARGLKVVAEGVETAEQAATLQALGCDCAQGFYFSRPIPARVMEQLLVVGAYRKASE
jgi:diguanylate cyclase (GGDEF)-like protein